MNHNHIFFSKAAFIQLLYGSDYQRLEINIIYLMFCLPVTCENRTVISSGNVTITTDGLITIATFTCADGYTLTGDAIQTCDTDGIWSAELPTCSNILTYFSCFNDIFFSKL